MMSSWVWNTVSPWAHLGIWGEIVSATGVSPAQPQKSHSSSSSVPAPKFEFDDTSPHVVPSKYTPSVTKPYKTVVEGKDRQVIDDEQPSE